MAATLPDSLLTTDRAIALASDDREQALDLLEGDDAHRFERMDVLRN